MATITENQPCTVLVELQVNPQQQQALIEDLAKQVEQQLHDFPGFISASFHATQDGQRIFNYAQWSTHECYEAFLERKNAVLQDVFDKYDAKLIKVDYPLRVARVVHASNAR